MSYKEYTQLSLTPTSCLETEEDSDLDKDLNRNMFQEFYDIFMFHCL